MTRIRAAWQALRGENRQNGAYTDALTRLILSNAELQSSYAGALEIAAGQVSRAFASAKPVGADAARVDAAILAEIGRDLIEAGESAWLIDRPRLINIPSFDLETDGDVIRYSLADGQRTSTRNFLLIRYSRDKTSNRGIAPLSRPEFLRELAEGLEKSLSLEAKASVGYILPIPAAGDDTTVTQLKEDIKGIKGGIAVVETTQGGWDTGRLNAPNRDFGLQRLGANFPNPNISLYVWLQSLILSACGVPTEIVERSDGAAMREGWRRFLWGTLLPLGKVFESECTRKGLDITLNWDDIGASDIAGRARAFGSLVKGGMSLEDAVAVTGLIADE